MIVQQWRGKRHWGNCSDRPFGKKHNAIFIEKTRNPLGIIIFKYNDDSFLQDAEMGQPLLIYTK